jgi:hypothetical protein
MPIKDAPSGKASPSTKVANLLLAFGRNRIRITKLLNSKIIVGTTKTRLTDIGSGFSVPNKNRYEKVADNKATQTAQKIVFSGFIVL